MSNNFKRDTLEPTKRKRKNVQLTHTQLFCFLRNSALSYKENKTKRGQTVCTDVLFWVVSSTRSDLWKVEGKAVNFDFSISLWCSYWHSWPWVPSLLLYKSYLSNFLLTFGWDPKRSFVRASPCVKLSRTSKAIRSIVSGWTATQEGPVWWPYHASLRKRCSSNLCSKNQTEPGASSRGHQHMKLRNLICRQNSATSRC